MHLTSQPIAMGDMALDRDQEVMKQQVSNVITKMSKEERSELKHKLESMEEKEDPPEVNISVMLNFWAEILGELKMTSHPWKNLKRSKREILLRL